VVNKYNRLFAHTPYPAHGYPALGSAMQPVPLPPTLWLQLDEDPARLEVKQKAAGPSFNEDALSGAAIGLPRRTATRRTGWVDDSAKSQRFPHPAHGHPALGLQFGPRRTATRRTGWVHESAYYDLHICITSRFHNASVLTLLSCHDELSVSH
jgi:hypothetical protein